LTPFHIPFRAHEIWPSVVIAVLAFIVSSKTGGQAIAAQWLMAADRVDDRILAGALATVTCILGIAYATTVAGAADPYGYVSQADLWLKGPLKISQPWMQQAPWPSNRWTFTPLGYAPGLTASAAATIVPVYPPGLPLLMAAVKGFAGQEAMFWVVPILGGLLVLATFGVGRRLGASRAGLVGAFLVATSPAVLFNFMDPTTD